MQRLPAKQGQLIILPQRVMQGLPFTQLLLVILVQRYMPIPVDSLAHPYILQVQETLELPYMRQVQEGQEPQYCLRLLIMQVHLP